MNELHIKDTESEKYLFFIPQDLDDVILKDLLYLMVNKKFPDNTSEQTRKFIRRFL